MAGSPTGEFSTGRLDNNGFLTDLHRLFHTGLFYKLLNS